MKEGNYFYEIIKRISLNFAELVSPKSFFTFFILLSVYSDILTLGFGSFIYFMPFILGKILFKYVDIFWYNFLFIEI